MSNGELEQIIVRNGNYVAVRRAGSDDGYVSVHNAITGLFILGINGGRLTEYSRMRRPMWGCSCTPNGYCKRSIHGTDLIRGWRNILTELVARGSVRVSKEIERVIGGEEARQIRDYHGSIEPGGNPAPEWEYQQLRSA
jgi:hypothetical protein